MQHDEFVVLMKDGTRDWVDPVFSVVEDDEKVVVHNGSYNYSYKKSDIEKWTVRPYSHETTNDTVE